MKSLIFTTAIVFVLSSCERETHINIPPQPPKLAVESRQGQNVFPETWVSRTRGVTDPIPQSGQPNPYIIKTATVLLYEDDVLKDTLRYNNTTERYKASLASIQTGKTYKLVISATGYPTAQAISFTPSQVLINNLSFTPNARFDADGYPQDEVRISFTDQSLTGDYYLIRILDAFGNYLYCVNSSDKDVEKQVDDDPLYSEACLQSDRLLLSDLNFNGTTKTVIFYVESGSLKSHNTPGGTKRATVELLHINKDYYKYIKSLNTYENANDNPFAEPVNLYTNVSNGFGLFTTYAKAVDSLP